MLEEDAFFDGTEYSFLNGGHRGLAELRTPLDDPGPIMDRAGRLGV